MASTYEFDEIRIEPFDVVVGRRRWRTACPSVTDVVTTVELNAQVRFVGS